MINFRGYTQYTKVKKLYKIDINFINEFMIRFRHFLLICTIIMHNELFELVKNDYSLQHWYMAYIYAVKIDDQSILPGTSSNMYIVSTFVTISMILTGAVTVEGLYNCLYCLYCSSALIRM